MFFKSIKTLSFLFLFPYMRFVLFVSVKFFLLKKKATKTALMTSFTLLLAYLEIKIYILNKIQYQAASQYQACMALSL